ncbi:MAG TPA: right-handed parallel beta-helix repeat-containing protein [Polyangia bacterium]|nr:right-handed parallel beta-helix repeat-containing protein [Polyangia bacterium]
MTVRASLALALVAALLGFACTKHNPRYCAGVKNSDCMNVDAGPDGDAGDAADASDAADAADASDSSDADAAMEAAPEHPMCTQTACGSVDGGPPICDVDAGMCRGCASADECVNLSGGALRGCDSDERCYPCTKNVECTVSTTPICEAHGCRACKQDSECGDPGVCVGDGHCATNDEVVFIEYSDSGCSGANGSSASPYCSFHDASPFIGPNSSHTVVVLRGAALDQLILPTFPAGSAPLLVVGRKSAGGDDPNIGYTTSSAVIASSGTITVRDLAIAGGTSSQSIGVKVSGTAKLNLSNVTVSGGKGLGIDVSGGANLTLDRCSIVSSAAGGLSVHGGGFVVQNTIIASNGFGAKLLNVSAGSQFWFDTVVGSAGSAIACDTSSPTIDDSVIQGFNDGCTLNDTLTPTSPTYSAVSLPPAMACTTPPATFPDHDYNGKARGPTASCGAVQ